MPEDKSARKSVQEQIQSIESLVREIEKLPDANARTACTALVQSIMQFHAAAIERMLDIVHDSGHQGQSIIDDLGGDELAGNLLLLHGLHPLDLQTRVLRALDKARPYLQSHGGNVELVTIDQAGAVTVRLQGSCHSCPSSSATLQSTVEQAIYAAAPDATAILVEGAEAQAETTSAGFVQIANIRSAEISETPPEKNSVAVIGAESGAQ
jgi:Fe-S cluster biogenesis protein NfuA